MPLINLAGLSFQDDRYSHTILIPFISLISVYLERKRIFTESEFCPRVGIPLIALGVILSFFAKLPSLSVDQHANLALSILAVVLIWAAGFVLCYGTQAFSVAIFPLCFLVLMIPIPTMLVQKASFSLQKASAEIVYVLFNLADVPVLREGFRFSLPGGDIEIAEQCSGIRSTLAFFIISLWAGHLFLRSSWRRACFSLFTIPIVIFKNAVRIVSISLLGLYVNPGFLNGRLHHYGGLAFGFLGLAILVPLLFLLQKSESRGQREQVRPDLGEDDSGENRPTPLSSRTEAV